jgi:hypothetical protein
MSFYLIIIFQLLSFLLHVFQFYEEGGDKTIIAKRLFNMILLGIPLTVFITLHILEVYYLVPPSIPPPYQPSQPSQPSSPSSASSRFTTFSFKSFKPKTKSVATSTVGDDTTIGEPIA